MLSKWKTGLAAAAVTLAVAGGAGVASARANDFEATFENGQYVLHNVSGSDRNVSDIEWVDQGDMAELYHWNFGCSSGTLGPDDTCIIYVEGTHGVIAVTTDEAGEEDVTLSDGS